MSEGRIRILTQGLRQAEKGFRSLTGQARMLGSTLAGVGAGIGLAAGAKAVLDFDQQLGALQRDSGLSTEKMKQLRAQILGLNAEFAIGKDDITGVLKVFQDLGGNLKQGIQLMPELTKASKATGASMQDLGTIAASMVNAGDGPEKVMVQIRAMANQAENGTINMKQLASVGAELVGMAKSKGMDFTQLVTSLQTVGQVVPNVQEARTSLKAMVTAMVQNQKKISQLSVGGKKINPFEFVTDPATGAKRKVLRNIKVLMGEILTATKRDPIKLQEIFGTDAGKAVDAFMLSFDEKLGTISKGTFARVEKAGAEAPEDFFNKKIATLASGIDAEGEKLRKGMAQAEQMFQNLGKKLMLTVAEDPAAALKTTAGAIAAVKFGPTLVSLLFKLNTFNSGLSGAAGSLTKKGGLIVAAGAAGYALGTLIDKTFGFSDAISKGMFALLHPDVTPAQQKRNDQEQALLTLKDQAAMFAGLSSKGVTSFGAKGEQKQLTQQNAMSALIDMAKKQGVTQEQMQKVMPELLAILKTGKFVQIKAVGIDQPKVVESLGPSQ